MKKKKGGLSTGLIILFLLAGMSLLLYPTVADVWNKMHQARAISTYNKTVEERDPRITEELRRQAEEYNRNISARENVFAFSDEEKELYNSLLNVEGNGIMGYVNIPGIKVSLPIYHGTEDTVLQAAVGHVDWTALPVGGEGTHCVLSGHCGLPSARLFTDLDQMKEGDIFRLHVLGDVLTYEVDQIVTVLPEEMEYLVPVEGMDLCTLLTCTPYGINTHRLLVRGHRIGTVLEKEKLVVSSEATLADTKTVAVFIAVPLLLLLFIIALLIRPKKPKANKGRENREEAPPQHTGTHAAGSQRKPPEETQKKHRAETQKKRKGGAHLKQSNGGKE